MQVREVLKAKGGGAIHMGPEATVAEAIERLVQCDIGSLPIVDREGRLVGIFTERDVLRGFNRDCEGFHHRQIHQVMTRNPVTCDLDDDVHEIMGKMARHKVGQLPVTCDDDLVGVVSVGDVVKLLYHKVEAENQHLVNYLYGPG